MDKMMKAMVKQVEEMVEQLSTKYGFDKAEAMEFIMPAGETVRGRPSKPKKKVVNKMEMVEDVIMSIMEGELAHVADAAVTNVAQAEPVIVASEGGLKVDTPLKKKAAPKKKKAEATVVEAVALVAPDIVAALIAVESTDEAQAEPVIVAAVEAPKEKKKAAPRKKKAEAPVTEAVVAVVVVAQAEPVAVGVGLAAVVEATKEKKKAAPKKKKAEAEAAVVAQAEPVTVAVAAVVEATKEKKKAAPKKAEAAVVEVVAQAEPVTVAAVVEAPKEKKKAAPKKKAEAVAAVAEAPKPVPVVEAPKPAAVSPTEEVSENEDFKECNTDTDDEESTCVSEWRCKKDGKVYLKSCEDNCGEDTCDCAGVVYDTESQDVIGRWNGVTIEIADDDE